MAGTPGTWPRPVARPALASNRARATGSETARAGFTLPLLRSSDPVLLSPRHVLRQGQPFLRGRHVALLDHPPVGRRVLRALRHRDGGHHLPPARDRLAPD